MNTYNIFRITNADHMTLLHERIKADSHLEALTKNFSAAYLIERVYKSDDSRLQKFLVKMQSMDFKICVVKL